MLQKSFEFSDRGAASPRSIPISVQFKARPTEQGVDWFYTPKSSNSPFSSAEEKRCQCCGIRRSWCCARRPPTSLRSTGGVTNGLAAVASTHRPHRPHHPPRPRRAFARSPELHRQPRSEIRKKNKNRRRRQPARAGQSPRRTGGWCGSVCSRRCAPRPSRARRGQQLWLTPTISVPLRSGCCARRPRRSLRSPGAGAIGAPIRHSRKRNRRRRPAGDASGSLCCMSARAQRRQGIKTSPKCRRESTAETQRVSVCGIWPPLFDDPVPRAGGAADIISIVRADRPSSIVRPNRNQPKRKSATAATSTSPSAAQAAPAGQAGRSPSTRPPARARQHNKRDQRVHGPRRQSLTYVKKHRQKECK